MLLDTDVLYDFVRHFPSLTLSFLLRKMKGKG